MPFKLPDPARPLVAHLDTLPSSAPLLTPVHTVPTMQLNDASETSFTTTQKEDKLPHDASVFVGSLPSNIDQGDLTRMLMEHFLEHTQIKNIKVTFTPIRKNTDIYAPQNANSATALIQTLHSRAPKSFLGRILRYEPARAFRTLLVSYRTPTQNFRSAGIDGANSFSSINKEIELELPDAMRIWKHRNSRFHSMLYNSDAVQAEQNCEGSASGACVLDNVIFLQPLKFDEETLRKLTSYFGPLEKFSPLLVPRTGEENVRLNAEGGSSVAYMSYPAPHNAPRSPTMNNVCWEIKWEHRDDCVSALMTLRRVPHLTVTWAHQPVLPGQTSHPNYSHVNSSPSYSLHVQHQAIPSQMFMSSNGSASPQCQLSREAMEGPDIPSADIGCHLDLTSPRASLERGHSGRASVYDLLAEDANVSTTRKGDTPALPIEEEKITPKAICRMSWADRGYSPDASLVTDQDAAEIVNDIKDMEEKSAEKISDNLNDLNEGGVQELYMPQTPALDTTSITPITPGSQFPATPTSCDVDASQGMTYKGLDVKENYHSFKGPRPDREIDPTTLFVGGLEMFGPGAWDEEKVRNFFARFGGLESVKVVRPLNSCAAFAFVKFNNAEAPARAVIEEHNRVYDGRAMRVQLRDCNPPRNNWKYGRARGRPHQNHFGIQRRFHYRPPYDGQDQMLIQVQNENAKSNFQDPNNVLEIQLSSLAGALPSISRSPVDDSHLAPGSKELPPSSSDLSTTTRNSPPTEKYREWYDEPVSLAHTPEPSSLGSSVSTAGGPFSTSPYAYPLSHGPYFPPQPWMQPYMAQAPYQVPYYSGYPVYSAAAPHQPPRALASPPSSDAGGAAMGAQPNWPHLGVYASYIPYPTVLPRPAVVDQGQPPQMTTQAPLIPTGFIQNEQGTLVAVYQPEALDQYMTGSGRAPAPADNHLPNVVPQRWGSTSPYPYDLGNVQPNNIIYPSPSQGRVKNSGFSPGASQQFSDFQHSPAPLHGLDNSFNFNVPSPSFRRQGQRREAQQNYGSIRHHNHPRPYNGRLSRGHLHTSAHIQPSDLVDSAAQPALTTADWNKWNGPR
ncbi:hypothetical protein BDZ97DRAFT_1912112 [Flammula alnicola]|nr:hypothetical protein BDZ97DRAFT_1912112 [Flammula alnicola]